MDNFDADNWLRFRTHGPAAGNGVDDEGSGNDATTREVLAATNPWFSGSGGSSVPNPAQPHSGGSFLNSDAQVRALEGLDLNDGGAWSDVQRSTGILLPQDGDTSMELPPDRAPSRRGSRAAGLRSSGCGAGGRRRSGAAEAPMSPLLPGSQRDATTEGGRSRGRSPRVRPRPAFEDDDMDLLDDVPPPRVPV